MRYKLLLIVLFLLFNFYPSYAKNKLVNSLGVSVGASLPQGGWDPGFTTLVQADMGEAIKYLYFSPYLGYARAGKSEPFNDQAGNLVIQYLTLGMKIVGYINSKPQGFYAGTAISYNLINYDFVQWAELTPNTYIANENTTKIGFSGLAGYLFMLKNLSIFVEADYMFTAGGFNNLSVFTGVNFNL